MAAPSKYRPEFAEQAAKLCKLGATDLELADFFRVSERTINTWKVEYAPFAQALKRGKHEADDRVEQSLYRRAIGYSHEAVKIFCMKDDAEPLEVSKEQKRRRSRMRVKKVKYTEHYAPDTTACIFWLKNRVPDFWRDKFDVDTGLTRDRAAEFLQLVEQRLAELAQAPAGADPDARLAGPPH